MTEPVRAARQNARKTVPTGTAAAFAAWQRGDLKLAERACRAALLHDPNDRSATRLSGVLATGRDGMPRPWISCAAYAQIRRTIPTSEPCFARSAGTMKPRRPTGGPSRSIHGAPQLTTILPTCSPIRTGAPRQRLQCAAPSNSRPIIPRHGMHLAYCCSAEVSWPKHRRHSAARRNRLLRGPRRTSTLAARCLVWNNATRRWPHSIRHRPWNPQMPWREGTLAHCIYGTVSRWLRSLRAVQR